LFVAFVYDGRFNSMPTLADFELQLPSGRSPLMQLYNNSAPVGVPILGTASINPSIYVFPFSSVGVAPGTYSYRITNPEGAGRIRVTATTVEQIDCGLSTSGNTTVVIAPDLASIRAGILVRIAELTSQPKPNYEIDGQKVSWQNYLDSLVQSLQAINALLLQDIEPFEIVSRGAT
jgi:hypothetical protein